MEKKNYREFSDEKLVSLAREGDERAEEYLLTKYKDFVRSKARAYFLVGGDSDDLIQEGMIGLYNAIGHYEEDKDSSFMTYAAICINNKMLSAVTADNRLKNSPLHDYVSLDSTVKNSSGEAAPLSEVISSDGSDNPESIVIGREQDDYIKSTLLGQLSDMEKKILACYIEGLSYQKIAESIGKSEKSVDNAIQRIRNKIKKLATY